jgi:hypothetical protein
VLLTPDATLHLHALERVATDRERNDAWLASGCTVDARDTLVERTLDGALVVEVLYFRRFTRTGRAPTNALPVEIRNPDAPLNAGNEDEE